MAIFSKSPNRLLVNLTSQEIQIALKDSVLTKLNKRKESDDTKAEDTVSHEKRSFPRQRRTSGKIESLRGDELIVIAADSTTRLKSEYLKLFNYEPFVKNNTINVIEENQENNVKVDHIITNKTARKIGITNNNSKEKEVIIPAFGSRKMDILQLNHLNYQPWEDMNLIDVSVEDQESEELKSAKWTFLMVWVVYGWLFVLIMKWIGLGIHFGKPESFFSFSIWMIWPAVAFFATIIYAFLEIYYKKKIGIKRGFVAFTNFLYKLINMFGLYIWPVIVPIAVVVFFGGILQEIINAINLSKEFIPITSEKTQQFNEMFSSIFSAGLLLRLMQLLFIIILATIPGMLYFQYERRKIGSLRTQFIRNIMFLNPLIHTVDDAEIRYGTLVDEISMSAGANSKQFSILRTGRPILISTMLITLCWIFTFWPVGMIPEISNSEIINSIIPRNNLISFAFLGAYFFAINLIFKRYARGDLSPKAYSHISIRILSSIIIVWVLGLAAGEDLSNPALENGFSTWSLYVIAFGIGLIPETGIVLFKQVLESEKLKKLFPNFKAKHPITELEGINLYDKARLTEEGVESVETLAHHNMIELMLRSGIPVARIVDLVDQAILYLHTTGIVGEDTLNKGDKKLMRRGIDILRDEGIRTATDLLSVEKAINESTDSNTELKKRRDPELFYTLLDSEGKKTYRLQRVLDALKDDEWLVYVMNWRCIGLCENKVVTDPNTIVKAENEMDFIYENFQIKMS